MLYSLDYKNSFLYDIFGIIKKTHKFKLERFKTFNLSPKYLPIKEKSLITKKQQYYEK